MEIFLIIGVLVAGAAAFFAIRDAVRADAAREKSYREARERIYAVRNEQMLQDYYTAKINEPSKPSLKKASKARPSASKSTSRDYDYDDGGYTSRSSGYSSYDYSSSYSSGGDSYSSGGSCSSGGGDSGGGGGGGCD